MARLMKDSGIPWIREIPVDWEIERIGRLYDERREKVSDLDYPPLSVTMRGVLPQLSTAAKTDAHDDRKLVRKGDFAINSRSDRRGSCGISPYDGSVSLINTILIPRREMHPVFYEWLFHSSMFSDEFYKWGHGIVDDLWTTNWQDMKKIFVPLPPIEIQLRIANFLDAECTRIDAIIEQTRATVEEYKKLKQAIITQAVTKGIRPNRPMKDSGIEWIGEIPDDWEIHKLCWDYSAELGKMLDAKRVTGEHLHPYIKNADVQWWRINALGLDEMDFSDDEYDRYTVKRGDLIICEGGEIGKCAVVPDDFPEGIYYQKALHRVRPRNRKISNAYYLSYVIFCMAKQDAFGTTHEKATIQHLPGDALSQLRIPNPPYNEQCQIVSYISNEMARIDGLIQKKEKLLTEIDSYRKSLIYEYVTGKKEIC